MVTPLHQIVREVGGALDFKAALQVLVHGVSRALRADVCSVYLQDEKGFLALMATEGLEPDSIGRIRLAFLVTLAAHLAGIITFVKASTDQNLLA